MKCNRSMTWLGIACALLAFGMLPARQVPKVEVAFYSTTMSFPKVFCSELDMPPNMSREAIMDAYEHFENCSYKPVLSALLAYQEEFQLSDWHLYEVTCRMAEATFQEKRFQIMFEWFMLRKAGLDVQVFYQGPDLYLHANCKDAEFGFYTLEHQGRSYINLSAKREQLVLDKSQAYVPDLMLDGQAGRPFSLRIQSLPRLPHSEVVERVLHFKHHGQSYSLKISLNQDQIQMMDDYPYYSQTQYFEVAISPEAEASLLPQLEEMVAGRSKKEQIELLLSFVRTSFFYKDDRKRFGHEKPMTPEQTLYHSYSDCEDRSSLFYYLVGHLLHLPAIVLDFEEHVGVAVQLDSAKGSYYMHKDRRFIYCEPTGPDDKLAIGEMWDYVRQMRARIMTDNLPN